MENQTLKKHKITKSSVVETLEVEASKPVHKSFNHNENDKLWSFYMLEKFGDDYVSMTKDHKKYACIDNNFYDLLSSTHNHHRISSPKIIINTHQNRSKSK